MKNKETLVLGGTGKTGRRVAQRLVALGHSVRIGSRTRTPRFDWYHQSTWTEVLTNIHAVYIAFQPDLAIPAAAQLIKDFADTAKLADVKKVVLLSGRGEEEAKRCEEIIMNSGMMWTIVRASWFNQNFSENYLLDPILAGHVALPVGDVREPFVDADDIADVAVAALIDDRHANKVYEVTGPRLITFREAINAIAKETGRNIVFQEVSIDEYASMLKQLNIPDEAIHLISYLFTEVLDGRNESIAHGVEEALDRKPKDFSEYVKSNIAAKIWNP